MGSRSGRRSTLGERSRVRLGLRVLGQAVGAMLALSSGPLVEAATDVDRLYMSSARWYEDEVAYDYYLDIEIHARGVDRIVVTPPGLAAPAEMNPFGKDTFYISWEDRTSLADLAADPGHGDYQFTIYGENGGTDEITVTHDPGTVDLFGSHPSVLAPAYQESDVSLDTVFSWTCSGSDCGPDGWYSQVVEYPTDEACLPDADILFGELFDNDQTTWKPGPVRPANILAYCVAQYIWVHSMQFLDATPDERQSVGGDTFTFVSAYERASGGLFSALNRLTIELGRNEIRWQGVPATALQDFIDGDLVLLRNSLGDFTAATDGCVANDATGSSTPYTREPGIGGALFVLGRADDDGQGYESLVESQQDLRDGEIAASGVDCP